MHAVQAWRSKGADRRVADGTEGGVNMTGYKYITFDDRKKIEKLYNDGMKITDIAVAVGFSFAAIYRELKRGYTGNYDSTMLLL